MDRTIAARPVMHQPLRLLHEHHRQWLGCDRGPRERPIRALSAPALRPSRRLLRRRPRPPAAAPLRPSSASSSERKRHSSVLQRYPAMERLSCFMGARSGPGRRLCPVRRTRAEEPDTNRRVTAPARVVRHLLSHLRVYTIRTHHRTAPCERSRLAEPWKAPSAAAPPGLRRRTVLAPLVIVT